MNMINEGRGGGGSPSRFREDSEKIWCKWKGHSREGM